MFPLAFVAGWLQGHWWGFISRNYVVWPIFFLMNVFIALKGSHFWFFILYQKWDSESMRKDAHTVPRESGMVRGEAHVTLRCQVHWWVSMWVSRDLSHGPGVCVAWVPSKPVSVLNGKIYLFIYADSKDADQTGQMPRLIWVFAGRTGQFVGFVMWWLKSCLWISRRAIRIVYWWNAETTITHQDLWLGN